MLKTALIKRGYAVRIEGNENDILPSDVESEYLSAGSVSEDGEASPVRVTEPDTPENEAEVTSGSLEGDKYNPEGAQE